MAHRVYAFEPPERFVAGTVGPPGDRTFFLQARGDGRLVSVALEKVQVVLLAEKLEELLAEAQRRFGIEMPELVIEPSDLDPLETPVDEEFRVGTLGLAYDVDSATVVIEAIAAGAADSDELDADTEEVLEEALDEDLDEDLDEALQGELEEALDEDLDRLRVRLTPEAVRAFVERARRVVAAGRPPCPLCGQPLDPKGHLCPRHNGYHR